MPTATFDVTAEISGELVDLLVTRNDQYIRSRVLRETVNSPEKLAAWVLQQRGRQQAQDPALQRRVTVTFHTEQEQDDTGAQITVTVIDDVQTEPLPRDAALDALPTPEQVAQMTTAAELRAVLVEVVRWIRG